MIYNARYVKIREGCDHLEQATVRSAALVFIGQSKRGMSRRPVKKVHPEAGI